MVDITEDALANCHVSRNRSNYIFLLWPEHSQLFYMNVLNFCSDVDICPDVLVLSKFIFAECHLDVKALSSGTYSLFAILGWFFPSYSSKKRSEFWLNCMAAWRFEYKIMFQPAAWVSRLHNLEQPTYTVRPVANKFARGICSFHHIPERNARLKIKLAWTRKK